jgi:hypothetical protein
VTRGWQVRLGMTVMSWDEALTTLSAVWLVVFPVLRMWQYRASRQVDLNLLFPLVDFDMISHKNITAVSRPPIFNENVLEGQSWGDKFRPSRTKWSIQREDCRHRELTSDVVPPSLPPRRLRTSSLDEIEIRMDIRIFVVRRYQRDV